VRELVSRARELGVRALALTDTDRMSGLIQFYLECRRQKLKPILGVELTTPNRPEDYVLLLARNARGYADLCEIVTRRQLDPSRFTVRETFARPWPDLLLLTASPDLLEVLYSSPNRARLYAEVVRNSLATRARGRALERAADNLGVPLVAANNSFFLEAADHEIHRTLRAIGLNATVSRLRAEEVQPANAYLKSAEAMQRDFADRPELVANTQCVADRCDVRLDLGEWKLPTIAVPGGYTPESYLQKLAGEGLRANYTDPEQLQQARAVQEMELEVISKLGYASYFLFVKTIRDWGNRRFRSAYRKPKDCTILRGSAANSITFYNIGVSDLDPIRYDLYFQRFLNEDRASPPDADLDFAWDEREEVYDYMVDTWGQDRVAVTCTTNHFRQRAAFRETAKVFGYGEEQISAILKSHRSRTRRIHDREIDEILVVAQQIVGKPRFLGQHPGGVIITNEPIWRHVACEFSGGEKNRMITQIDMHNGIDELGLIKFDILGNGSLAVLRDALTQLEGQGIEDPEVWNLEKCYADPQVRDILKNGRTRGIFYIESPAQIRLNQKARAQTFEEITVTSSLIRPAGTAYTQTYVERQRKAMVGVRDWEFVDPSLEPILGKTHDVCAFQEDVTKICHQIAGLSYKKTDRIRKMMNSAHEGVVPSAEWERTQREFLDGCQRNRGLDEAQAAELWRRVSSFTGFSFCKSHSATYAQLSFQCAYLKTRFPAQFLAAVVSNGHGFYRKEVYLNEARRWGVRILPLHINTSQIRFYGCNDWIRPGLMHLRGMRSSSMEAVIEERNEGGPFLGLQDFGQRVSIHRQEIENLILVGAFDGFGLTHPELLFQLDGCGAPAAVDQVEFRFGESSAREFQCGLSDFTLTERCLNELRLLGYMLSGNILEILDLHPAAKGAVPTVEIRSHVGRRVKLFGWPITERGHRVARSQQLMMFITLEDKTGCADVILWPDMLERSGDELVEAGPLEIWGTVSEDWDTFSVEADSVRAVEWSPALIDFELAARRLEDSNDASLVYAEVQRLGAA
jgi:DNA-directed DNA polymerase III PolC